jgi:WD40 repeat protein
VFPSFYSHDIHVLLNDFYFYFSLSHFSVLVDDSIKSGDLYIRSVCFSPDGKFLATGAEDKQIRVRLFFTFSNLSLSLEVVSNPTAYDLFLCLKSDQTKPKTNNE